MSEWRYSVKHLINLGNFESVTIEHSVLFDIDSESGTVSGALTDARSHIDEAIKTDLERAAQCTSLGADDTYVHDWLEEVYN